MTLIVVSVFMHFRSLRVFLQFILYLYFLSVLDCIDA